MEYNRSEYEKLIAESALFSLNKDRDSSAFRRESYKMVEYLYCYLLAVNKEKYEPFGCEITEVAMRCINNFDSSKGVFIHYFNAAWKMEYSHICGQQAVDEKLHGIRITEEEKRILKRYLQYEAAVGRDLTDIASYETIAELLGRSVEEIRHISEILEYHVVDNEISDEEGSAISLFDQISDSNPIDEKLLSLEDIRKIFAAIEQIFLSIQSRQRPIVSDMMTIRVAEIIAEFGIDTAEYTFIASDIMQLYFMSHILPTQREIAEKHKKNEASISRTIKDFTKKIRTVLEQKG